MSFQGGFGLVVHRWHRVLDSPSRGDISLCGETQELALHRFNPGAVCFDVVFGRPMDVFRRVVRIDFLRLRTPARDDPKSASCRRPRDEKDMSIGLAHNESGVNAHRVAGTTGKEHWVN